MTNVIEETTEDEWFHKYAEYKEDSARAYALVLNEFRNQLGLPPDRDPVVNEHISHLHEFIPDTFDQLIAEQDDGGELILKELLLSKEDKLSGDPKDRYVLAAFSDLRDQYAAQGRTFPWNITQLVSVAQAIDHHTLHATIPNVPADLEERYIEDQRYHVFHAANYILIAMVEDRINAGSLTPQEITNISTFSHDLAHRESDYIRIAELVESMETWTVDELLVAMLQPNHESFERRAQEEIVRRLEAYQSSEDPNDVTDRRTMLSALFTAREREDWQYQLRRNMPYAVRTLIQERPDLFLEDVDLLLAVFLTSTLREPTKDENDSSDWSGALASVFQYGREHNFIAHDFTISVNGLDVAPETLAGLTLVETWEWFNGIEAKKWGGDVLEQQGWFDLILELSDHFGALSYVPEVVEQIRQESKRGKKYVSALSASLEYKNSRDSG